jgi:lipoprotein NlpI
MSMLSYMVANYNWEKWNVNQKKSISTPADLVDHACMVSRERGLFLYNNGFLYDSLGCTNLYTEIQLPHHDCN